MPHKTKETQGQSCPKCHAKIGEWHAPGCEREKCPYCGRRLRTCLKTGCLVKPMNSPLWPPPLDDRIPWSGKNARSGRSVRRRRT